MFYRDYEGDPITNTTFAELLKPLLGDGATRRSPREYHGPRFEGRQLPLAVQLDAIARRDARMAEANAPAGPGVVQKVVETIADAVLPVPQTEIAKAVTWLQATLGNGPVPEKQVQEMARNAGIKARTLKRAKGRAGVKSLRIGQSRWDWALPA